MKHVVEEYLQTLTGQIRYKKARQMVWDEMNAHIEDQTEALIRDGMSEEEAVRQAVLEMGDPVETGIALDRVHRPRMAWGMIALAAALGTAGFLVQLLLSQKRPEQFAGDWSVSGGLAQLLLGLAVMMAVCFVDYSRIGQWARTIAGVLFGALLIGSFFGREVNGCVNWLDFGTLTVHIQPLLLLSVPLYGAILYQYRGMGYGGIARAIVWMIPYPLLALRIPTVATALLLVLAYVLLLSAAICQDWFRVSRRRALAALWGGMLLLPLIPISILLLKGGYQAMRLSAYVSHLKGMLTGSAQVPGGSYLNNTVAEIMANGRMIGETSSVIPDLEQWAGTDSFLFVYLTAYFGFLAVFVLAGALMFLFGRFLYLAARQKNQLGRMMGGGCAVVFLLQTVSYLLANYGLLLASNRMCPILGQGGTSAVVTYAMIGLMLSVCRHQNVLPKNPETRKVSGFWKKARE